MPIDNDVKNENNLSIPKNVSIKVEGIVMTVTWDAVKDELGYEIITTSVDCGSGNRTINTKEKTALVIISGNAASNVIINEGTSIEITLMAASSENQDVPMAA